jgi:hypothetical protein
MLPFGSRVSLGNRWAVSVLCLAASRS